LCRSQRLGVFGRRGVGKTTLLTMLYREAVAGRLAGLRLAAADARTAAYLSDKIVQLEAAQRLPATLAETELRFHLYAGGDRVELVVLDYQGEHVSLGRAEPVRDFLQGCDAVWLCLDAVTAAGEGASRWEAEQEAEQVVEDYLAAERAGEPHRPMALLATRSDLLAETRADAVTAKLGLTRHALEMHCPWHEVFAVRCLGPSGAPEPGGLDGPLGWLAGALRGQDEARLRRLWEVAPGELRLLRRATQAFARRYPDAPAAREFVARLGRARRRRVSRRVLGAAAVLLAGWLALWGYDAAGEWKAWRAAAAAPDPASAYRAWQSYQAWHPARRLFRPAAAEQERREMARLETEVREQHRQERLAGLRRRAADPDGDPESAWADFLQFRSDFPEHELTGADAGLRDALKKACDERRGQRARAAQAKREQEAQAAVRELERLEQSAGLVELVGRSTRLLALHAGTPAAAELAIKREGYLRRLDEGDFEAARDYSTRYPNNFYTRKQKYQHYLDRHPGGACASQAREALARVAREWDRHDFRAVAGHYKARPQDVKELRVRCQTYLSAHAEGAYRNKAAELLRWCDRVSEPGEYKVTLKSGSFSKKVAHLISRGAYLSVQVEVNGVRHGPSTIVKRSYSPEWDYEFPRTVRWKLGDSVRVIVTDNYYWKRKVADVTFEDDLAIRKLCGEVEVTYGTLTFACDFTMPAVPRVE
jgi:hypothetical protein